MDDGTNQVVQIMVENIKKKNHMKKEGKRKEENKEKWEWVTDSLYSSGDNSGLTNSVITAEAGMTV